MILRLRKLSLLYGLPVYDIWFEAYFCISVILLIDAIERKKNILNKMNHIEILISTAKPPARIRDKKKIANNAKSK